MTQNTLKLKKMGCDFWNDSPERNHSDIGNYRVRTESECIKAKNGKTYFLEFTLWRDKGHYRKTTKKGTRILKNPVFEIDVPFTLHIDTQYTDKKGSWRDVGLEEFIHKQNLQYTIRDILIAVNIIAETTYTDIEFI